MYFAAATVRYADSIARAILAIPTKFKANSSTAAEHGRVNKANILTDDTVPHATK
jgi:hypothetical protein